MLKNLRAIRQERHMTQQQVANHLGITRQALSNYENGTREPEYDLLCRLAELLRCPVGRLLGFSGAYESAGARIPILGTVKGGFNRLADQEFEGYEVADVASPDEYFFLRVTGDSMAPQIMDGDLVAVRSQPEVENGEIAVVRIGDEATLKKVSFDGTTMVLQPLNPAYPLMTYTGAALAEVHIEGKAVGLCRGL